MASLSGDDNLDASVICDATFVMLDSMGYLFSTHPFTSVLALYIIGLCLLIIATSLDRLGMHCILPKLLVCSMCPYC